MNGNVQNRERKGFKDNQSSATSLEWKPPLITIEPILCLFVLAGGCMYPAFGKLQYDKVCQIHFSANICAHVDNGSFPEQEKIVQKETAYWNLWTHYTFEIPAIIASFFFGSISDNYSRKLAIVAPLAGQILYAINLTINVYFMDLHVAYLMIGTVVSGICGGWIALYMACFSYIGVAIGSEDRTRRILLAEAVSGVATGVSLALSGVFLDYTNYFIVVGTSAAVYLLAAAYTLVFLKEPPRQVGDQGQAVNSTCCSKFANQSAECMKTVLKRRENNGRLRLLVIFLIALTSALSSKAIPNIAYLFLKHSPFNWNQIKYGYFLALYITVPSFFLLCITPLLKTKFDFKDTTLWIISIVSSSLGDVWFGYSTEDWMVYLVPVIGCLREVSNVIRSVISKLVPPNELGKIFAILGSMQSINGIIGSTIYLRLYPATVKFWPGLCFVIGGVVSVIPLSLICWLRHDLKRNGYSLMDGDNCPEPNESGRDFSRPEDDDTRAENDSVIF